MFALCSSGKKTIKKKKNRIGGLENSAVYNTSATEGN